MVKRTIGIRVLLSLGIVGLLMLIASPVMAVKITVNSTDDVIADDGKCTLREAVIAANTDTASGSIKGECQAGIGADTIVLQGLIYFLTIEGTGEDNAATGDLDILNDLTITGTGATKTFINGGKVDRVFHVIGNVIVNFKGVKIQNGCAVEEDGAGIYNSGGTVTVTSSVISNNIAYGDTNTVMGGGIFTESGTLTVSKSTISGNTTTSKTAKGGGIYINNSTLTIIGSIISNNSAISRGLEVFGQGGGIFSENGTVTVSKSTISSNMAIGINNSGSGGGISTDEGVLTISSSTISNNSATGINEGRGGGIINRNNNTLTITKSTISNNSATGVNDTGRGGGIYNLASSTVTANNKSKIFGNFASDYGGGIFNGGTLDISKDSKIYSNIPEDTN